jgi:hypothetical protein
LFDAAVGASEAPQQAEPAAAAGDAVVLVVLSVNGRLAPSLLPCMLHRRDDLRGQPMCLLSGLQVGRGRSWWHASRACRVPGLICA